MTDITRHDQDGDEAAPRIADAPARSDGAWPRETLVACIELLFFAYRDFTSGPDKVLAKYGFGRAHHRVLHFVHRNPGIRVANLLTILRITKQSLGRVLKDLIDKGFVIQRTGAEDRRERLLFATAKGSRLAERLMTLQAGRVSHALEKAGPGADEATQRFLLAMVGEKEQGSVEALVRRSCPKEGLVAIEEPAP